MSALDELVKIANWDLSGFTPDYTMVDKAAIELAELRADNERLRIAYSQELKMRQTFEADYREAAPLAAVAPGLRVELDEAREMLEQCLYYFSSIGFPNKLANQIRNWLKAFPAVQNS